MNESDSERLATVFDKKGYKPASVANDADLILVNMCSVRQSAVDRVDGLKKKLSELKTKNHKLKTILTGCILKSDKKKFSEYFDKILDTKNLIKKVKKYNAVKKENSLAYIPNKLAYIPISNGCNYSCSYCVVPSTRGRLQCRNHKKIIREFKEAVKMNVKTSAKEIWLLGQNVNDYSSPADSLIKFPELLEMAAAVKGDFSIRFMSPNPNNFSEKLIDVMANSSKIAKYLNIPLQSGDNRILKAMKRPYTSAQYKALIKKIRIKISNINLSTDIIVGFPGETKKQFENTAKLMKEIKFNIAYISKYSPRKGTVAYQMKNNIPIAEKKRRWKILNKIVNP